LINSYKIVFSYNGSVFSGSQKQINRKTVEGRLSQCLTKAFREDIKMILSGRTDSGVHAENQVANFKTTNYIPYTNIKRILNGSLSPDIVIKTVSGIEHTFNARKSAVSRTYKYLFSNNVLPIYLKPVVAEVDFEINETDLNKVIKMFKGSHNFEYFKKRGSNEKSDVREITRIECISSTKKNLYNPKEEYKIYALTIEANAFLYRMVRNIVGSVFEVLKGNRTLEELKSLLERESRFQYKAAEAKGLCLVEVKY
jgi:tRNA pseudouridine38-40 synthase